jgi:hypothetical protein
MWFLTGLTNEHPSGDRRLRCVAPNLIVSPESFDKFNNTGLIDLLVCLGSLVLRILSKVGVVGNRFLNPLNQTWALDSDALVQLLFKSRMTRRGHGKFSHRFLSSADRNLVRVLSRSNFFDKEWIQ